MHASRWTRAGAVALTALALIAAGCSHSPKPSAEAAGAGEGAAARTGTGRATRKTPAPNDGVVSGSSTSAPADSAKSKQVLPTLTPAQAKEMELLSKNDVDAAKSLLATLDPAKLDADRARKYEIAKGFLNDAITARAQQDWMRAAQLATKAKLLAQELTAQ